MFLIDKENNSNVASFVVFLGCYILLAIIAIRPVFSYDAYWHLQMGKDLLENGLSPWIDHYSFSYPGKEVSSVPVFFQLLLYRFVSLFGEEQGFYFIKLAYITLIMSALYVYFKKIKANAYVVLLLLPVIVTAIYLRLLIRPEIISNVLILVCLLLYLKAKKTFATKELVYICLLLLFWVNYHSPIFGYLIVFGLFFEKAVNKILDNDVPYSWGQWCFWGVVIFLIGFVRPNGQHFIVVIYNVMADDFGKYTQEYAAAHETYSTNIIVHISWALSVYVAIWSLVKKQYGFVFIAAVLTYMSLTMSRLITTTLLINLCILALYFSQLYSGPFINVRSSIKKALIAVAACISILSLYYTGQEAYASIKSSKVKSKILETRYPVQAADYLKHYQEGGNILNVMHTGGFLINRLSPDFKVYFDGRTNILYPIEFLEHNVALLSNKEELIDTIEQYDVEYALYENIPAYFVSLQNANGLELIFADEGFILFAKKGLNAFPLSSKLLVFPSCWNDEWSAGILQEAEMAEALFKDKNYSIMSVLKTTGRYLSHENKQQYFDELQPELMRSDAIRRVALHLALNSNNLQAASDIFSSIHKKTEYDILFYAYHMVNNKRYADAENLLYYFFKVVKLSNSNDASLEKMAIVIHVLEILEDNNALGRFSPSLKAGFEKQLQSISASAEQILTFEHICQ